VLKYVSFFVLGLFSVSIVAYSIARAVMLAKYDVDETYKNKENNDG